MRRFLTFLLITSLIVSISASVLASEVNEPVSVFPDPDDVPVFLVDYEFEDMTVIFEARKTDGTLYQIARDPSDLLWCFVDGERLYTKFLIFVDGYYYFVRSIGVLAVGAYSVSAERSNGLLPAGNYTFDSDGRLVDPPYLPDNWEADWNYVPPTEPTEPVPTQPIGPEEGPPVVDAAAFNAIMSMLAVSVSSASGWFSSVFNSSGMVPVFLSIFFIVLVLKFLLAPVIGGAGSDKVKKRRSENE